MPDIIIKSAYMPKELPVTITITPGGDVLQYGRRVGHAEEIPDHGDLVDVKAIETEAHLVEEKAKMPYNDALRLCFDNADVVVEGT